jgi:hypothetical protein
MKLEVKIPFSGFYGGAHDSEYDRVIEELASHITLSLGISKESIMTDLERFTLGTIEALYFTNTGDLDPETKLDLEADCRSFWHRFGCYVPYEQGQSPEQAGRDFWLTRNGHGSGFWDGDWPTYGQMLTNAAESYGPFETFENNGV